jgi:hypothetical protein
MWYNTFKKKKAVLHKIQHDDSDGIDASFEIMSLLCCIFWLILLKWVMTFEVASRNAARQWQMRVCPSCHPRTPGTISSRPAPIPIPSDLKGCCRDTFKCVVDITVIEVPESGGDRPYKQLFQLQASRRQRSVSVLQKYSIRYVIFWGSNFIIHSKLMIEQNSSCIPYTQNVYLFSGTIRLLFRWFSSACHYQRKEKVLKKALSTFIYLRCTSAECFLRLNFNEKR